MPVKNIGRRLDAAGILLAHTRVPGVSNLRKSSYYRSAIVLLCTVVEGMVFEYVKKNTTAPDHVVGTTWQTVERHKLPASIMASTGNGYFVHERLKKDILITDNGFDFGKLNLYLRNHSLISAKEFSELNWVRKERNRIHIQGLSTPDIGYTNAKIERISDAIRIMLNKLYPV
jgi:hypothetical protein